MLIAWGVGRIPDTSDVHPAWPVASVDADFVPVGPWNCDGLIVLAPLLNEARSAYIQRLIAEGYPVIFVATGEPGPRVAVDNEDGIRQALRHLAEHGHRRIAFVAGDPDDQGDSAQRLAAYQATMAALELEGDPRLVAYGAHNLEGGYAAAQQILNSGVVFTALLASDDSSAIGAMRALQAAGRRIPFDVAVIGVDDQPEAMAQVPPLTSVHVPLAEIGARALTLLLDAIQGRGRLESVSVPAHLVTRQSCGCMSNVALGAADSRPLTNHKLEGRTSAAAASRLALEPAWGEAMGRVFPANGREPERAQTHRLITQWVAALTDSLNHDNPAPHQAALLELLQEVERARGNVHALQAVVTQLRRSLNTLPLDWSRGDVHRRAEDMLHQARVAISDSAQREDRRHRLENHARANQLSLLTARLSAAFDDVEAVQILAEHLPQLGIRHARVVLLEPAAGDATRWSVVVSADSQHQPNAGRFLTQQFPPAALYPVGELLSLVVLPVVFQEEPLGYVAFDGANLAPCVALARQLAATLKGARLHAQLVELSLTDSLTGLHNRRYFELLLNNDVERSRRFRHGLSVIMGDLDRFKDYNDTFGHPAGDEALQRVAQCLREGRRKADVVVRYGGEEFAILLPETDAADALQVAEKIRAAVVNLGGLKRPLTISLGVASLRERGADAEELIDQADRALYQAKRTGRNRTHVY